MRNELDPQLKVKGSKHLFCQRLLTRRSPLFLDMNRRSIFAVKAMYVLYEQTHAIYSPISSDDEVAQVAILESTPSIKSRFPWRAVCFTVTENTPRSLDSVQPAPWRTIAVSCRTARAATGQVEAAARPGGGRPPLHQSTKASVGSWNFTSGIRARLVCS